MFDKNCMCTIYIYSHGDLVCIRSIDEIHVIHIGL